MRRSGSRLKPLPVCAGGKADDPEKDFPERANDFGYKTTTIHDACATCDLEFGGITTPAAQVHAAMMAALAFAYGEVISTDELLAGAARGSSVEVEQGRARKRRQVCRRWQRTCRADGG